MMDLTSPWNSLDLADDSWNSESSNPNPTDELTSSPEASESTHSLQWDHPTTVPGTYGANPSYFGPTIDFTSEQAAQALTSLSHPPIKNFETDDFLDCCQPCDQQCNPDEIFQCFSVDTVPCYDEKCSQTCELDGVNTLCNDSHLDGMVGILCCLHEGCTFQTLSEAELLHHCTIAHACGAKTHWECRNHTIPEPGALHGHVHNEHCRDEFINPLLLHPDGCSKKPAVPPHYHVHDHHHPPLQRFHDSHAGFHFDSSHNSKAYCRGPERNASYLQDEMRHIGRTQSGLNSLREESRTSSRHTSLSMASPDLNCTSPISSARSEHFETISDGQSGVQQVYTCSWIPEKATAPCSLTFNTAFELQIHVEESHLALHEYTAMSKKAEQLMCRWNGCTFAQTKKKWRQVQHLKDHLRTHTKHKAYRCDQCNRLFSEKKSLEQHRRTHTGEKPFKCDVCGASFSHQSTLSTHRRTHTGEKPYCCEICGHRDADHANFQRHKLIHEPAKYKCQFCDAEFKKKANMLRHQKNKACRNLKE